MNTRSIFTVINFGGSIRPETVWEILTARGTKHMFKDIDALYDCMTFRNDSNYGFMQFLNKFSVLNHVKWDEEAIDLAIKQVVSDLNDEGIKYCELRFSIEKYLNHIPWDEHQACLFFLERLEFWAAHYGVKVGPILSIKYESPRIGITRVSKLINHWRVAEKLEGLDFVGDESMADKFALREVYRYWKSCGKKLLIHAGETQPHQAVVRAIELLKVDRIAHGITIIESEDAMKLAKDNDVVFDVALTSNVMTGVADYVDHPIKVMLDNGLKITLGTDDPATFCCTLADEYEKAALCLGDWKKTDICQIAQNSVRLAPIGGNTF